MPKRRIWLWTLLRSKFIFLLTGLLCIHWLSESCSLLLADRCNMPLGLEDKRLTPGALTASTYYNHHLSPWHGRLNHRWSWSARTRNNRQWFKVNFGYITRFKGIATQGRQDANQWVKTYIVTYSRDGVSYVPYKENRRIKVRVLLHVDL